MDRTTDVHRARKAMDSVMPLALPLRNMFESPSSPENESTSFLQPPDSWASHSHDVLRVADWGTKHPDYQKITVKGQTVMKRATWTDEEIEYIAKYCLQKVETNPEAKATIVASCLEHIQRDPEALPIFHPNHVLDSSRLRNGYRSALNKGLLSPTWV